VRFRNKLRLISSTNENLLAVIWSARTLSRKRRLLFEQLSTRQVLAEISGIVFEDTDGSWRPDAGEARLQSRVVFVDVNNNSQLDDNDPLQFTDAVGRFEFTDLTGDQAIVRLFQGSGSAAVPFFPVTPNVEAALIAITGGTGISSFADDVSITIAGANVERSDLSSGQTKSIAIPANVRAAEPLPDGRILVLASQNQANHSFVIDSAGAVSPLALQVPAPANGWADVAIDASGKGVLVEQSAQATLLRSISIGPLVTVTNSTVSVGAGTRVVSGGATMTVVSTPTDDGLLLRLWSNATGTEITTGGVKVLAGQEVLSYDDASGLVLLRTTADTVQLLDASAGFASLQTITGVPGPVVLDPSREVLYAVSAANATLQIIDTKTTVVLSQFAVQASAGTSDIAFDSTTGKLLLLTSAGIKPIALDRADSHLIKITSGSPSFPVLFALPSAAAQNTAPRFDELPLLAMPEDTVLVVPAPELFRNASDAENDTFIVRLDTQANNGVVTIRPNGGLTYVPNRDFFGVDVFKVILADGRNASDPIELSITVTPVDDVFGINVTPNVIPEYLGPDFIAGIVNVINGGGGQIIWILGDPRFQVDNDEFLIITPGSRFDFETEPTVIVNVSARDVATGSEVSKSVEFSIRDQDDPIVRIEPDSAAIDENRPGDLIAEITVFDEGTAQEYTFTVDDNRFVVDFRDLRLKPGISLDFEAEQSVTVNVTATSAGGRTKTEPIVITVKDIGEQSAMIELSRTQVKELVRGAVVGDVIVDGNPLPAGLIATVNDTRFAIIGKVLKLRSSEFVRLADQQDIQIRVTVQDASANFLPISGTFVLEVLANPNPFHNPNNIYDVNDDGRVTALDALLIINSLSRHGAGPISGFPSPDRFYDVNGDGRITALDALLVINFLNRQRLGIGEGEAPANDSAPIAGGRLASSVSPLSAPTPASPLLPTEDELANDDSMLFGAESSDVNITQNDLKAGESELQTLREIVIDLLASDTMSDAEEVDAAINSGLF